MRVMWTLLFSLVALTAYAGPSEETSFEAELSHLAKDEMAIVDRLRRLREATEKLPNDWKSSMRVDGQVLHKQLLLSEIQDMEFVAAGRWNLLLQNLANMSRPATALSTVEIEWRKELKSLRPMHRQINDKLDRFNAQLKEGILLNLARQIERTDSKN